MPRRGPSEPRVGLLTPYWDYFEPIVPFDLRGDRAALTAEIAQLLEAAAIEVFDAGLVDSRSAGAAAAARLEAERVEVLLVIQALCVPPAFALAALEQLSGLPLVVAAASRAGRSPERFDHAAIVAEGATVGAPQLTNALHRTGRAHRLVAAAVGSEAEERDLLSAVVEAAAGERQAGLPEEGRRRQGGEVVDSGASDAAAAAQRLREARILRVGAPIDGYVSVDCDPDDLRRATGIELVQVAPAELRQRYAAITAADEAALAAEVDRRFDLGLPVAGQDVSRSLRLALALERLDRELDADAGAINCHVPELHLADDPGITACFALGRETSAGVPWSCSGDAVTAVAMLTLKQLGASALYHEIEALDRIAGEALLANSGEHDLGLAAAGPRPQLLANRWWERDGLCGACACFTVIAGPATLVAFTPNAEEKSGFRFVVAEGEFTQRRLPDTGTPHAGFRFSRPGTVVENWLRWARAGVNHHSAATGGHWAGAVKAVAAELGVGCVEIG